MYFVYIGIYRAHQCVLCVVLSMGTSNRHTKSTSIRTHIQFPARHSREKKQRHLIHWTAFLSISIESAHKNLARSISTTNRERVNLSNWRPFYSRIESSDIYLQKKGKRPIKKKLEYTSKILTELCWNILQYGFCSVPTCTCEWVSVRPFFQLECFVISAIQIQSRSKKNRNRLRSRIWIWPFTLFVW